MLEADRLETNTTVQILRQYELYVLDSSSQENHIIYAPLADSAFVASNQDLSQLAKAAMGSNDAESDYIESFNTLTKVVQVKNRKGYIHDERDFINLSILPNNVCNFSCAYCYSAKGRSSTRINFDLVKTTIDYFFDLPRPTIPPLITVSIFGGGEPMLSWDDVVRPTIEYIYNRKKTQVQEVVVTLITNGSIINEKILKCCKKYHIDLAISYDILKDVQETQRRHFDEVSNNIQHLLDYGITPAINSVVTELNVLRQVEMVKELHLRFPQIKNVSFEPVIGEIKDKAIFLQHFSSQFIEALNEARKYDIKLSCSTLRNMDVTVDRYCAGEFALCPDGSISICPCVSSANEPNYEKYIYGHVTAEGVNIDRNKLLQLLSNNVNSNPWCQHCFAKWNCGGGCMNVNTTNGNRQDQLFCLFTRAMIKHFLFERLEKTYNDEYNENLTKYINKDEYIIR